jgi:hypothetical protein
MPRRRKVLKGSALASRRKRIRAMLEEDNRSDSVLDDKQLGACARCENHREDHPFEKCPATGNISIKCVAVAHVLTPARTDIESPQDCECFLN